HLEPAWLRLLRQLAAPLFSDPGLQRQISARDRHAQLADAILVGCRRRILAEHRDFGRRPDWKREHQGLLAGGAFAGRTDLEPVWWPGFLPGPGRWPA